jgi:hypothetical protein
MRPTLKQQRDELANVYDAERGAGAAKRLFAQNLGKNGRGSGTLKEQINLLCEFVSFVPKKPAVISGGGSSKVSNSKDLGPANTISKRMMTRAEFDRLSPQEKTAYCRNGGKLTD